VRRLFARLGDPRLALSIARLIRPRCMPGGRRFRGNVRTFRAAWRCGPLTRRLGGDPRRSRRRPSWQRRRDPSARQAGWLARRGMWPASDGLPVAVADLGTQARCRGADDRQDAVRHAVIHCEEREGDVLCAEMAAGVRSCLAERALKAFPRPASERDAPGGATGTSGGGARSMPIVVSASLLGRSAGGWTSPVVAVRGRRPCRRHRQRVLPARPRWPSRATRAR
jgi:hypothetical protein